MKNKLRKITLKTLPNGYSLDVEGLHPGGFLYFNEMELLAGFITHVGLHEENPMESTKMLRILFQTIIGQEYVEVADNMMQTVAELNKRCQEMERKLVSSRQRPMPPRRPRSLRSQRRKRRSMPTR